MDLCKVAGAGANLTMPTLHIRAGLQFQSIVVASLLAFDNRITQQRMAHALELDMMHARSIATCGNCRALRRNESTGATTVDGEQ